MADLFDDPAKLDAILKRLSELKQKMKDRGLTIGKAKCLSCGQRKLVMSLSGRKQHMHAYCKACNFSMME